MRLVLFMAQSQALGRALVPEIARTRALARVCVLLLPEQSGALEWAHASLQPARRQ